MVTKYHFCFCVSFFQYSSITQDSFEFVWRQSQFLEKLVEVFLLKSSIMNINQLVICVLEQFLEGMEKLSRKRVDFKLWPRSPDAMILFTPALVSLKWINFGYILPKKYLNDLNFYINFMHCTLALKAPGHYNSTM